MKNKQKNYTTAKPDLIGSFENIKDLRKKVGEWLKSTFYKTIIINKQTKFEIGFNTKSFKKLVSGNVGYIKLISLTALKQIIELGELTKVDIDKKERSDILAYYYFESIVEVDKEKYKFWFTVRQLNTGKFIYSGNLDTKKTL